MEDSQVSRARRLPARARNEGRGRVAHKNLGFPVRVQIGNEHLPDLDGGDIDGVLGEQGARALDLKDLKTAALRARQEDDDLGDSVPLRIVGGRIHGLESVLSGGRLALQGNRRVRSGPRTAVTFCIEAQAALAHQDELHPVDLLAEVRGKDRHEGASVT